MLKIFTYIFLSILIVTSTSSSATRVLNIGVGNFPPFFIEDGKKGIFIDIIDEIFKQLPEYKVRYIFMSNHRVLHEINYGKSIDVACNIFPESKVNAFLSVPLFRYRDVAITRKSANIDLNSIADLQSKSIAAYQGSTELLGDSYKKMASSNTRYNEYAHPNKTTHLMLSGAKQVRIGDINIFWYDLKNKYYDQNIDQNEFEVHYLWPDVYSHMAFKDEELKFKVNNIIEELTESGTIEAIYTKYKVNKPKF